MALTTMRVGAAMPSARRGTTWVPNGPPRAISTQHEDTALAALAPGCVDRGLPADVASELFKFLAVRMHNPDAGPSTMLDALWHWMKLNDDVADAVHGALGGVVRHSTSTMRDPPATKMLRRLRSLNLLRRHGHVPRLELWQEPGVELRTVKARSGITVYVAKRADQLFVPADVLTFVAQHFCADGESLAGLPTVVCASQQRAVRVAGGGTDAPQPVQVQRMMRGGVGTAASTTAAETRQHMQQQQPHAHHNQQKRQHEEVPQADVADASLKRLKGAEETQQETQQQQPGKVILLILRAQTGHEAHFRVKPTTLISTIVGAYSELMGIEKESFRLLHDGESLYVPTYSEWPCTTKRVDTCALESGDVLDVVAEQLAC